MYSRFFVFKGVLEMRKRYIYGIALIKIDNIGLRVFVDVLLTSNSGQKLVMWDV